MEPTLLQKNIIKEAINGKGNILVEATAGSGKSTLLKLMADAILKDDPKAEILAVSYTNSIKDNLTEKLDKRCHVFSLHQIGMGLIRSSGLGGKYKWVEHLNGKEGNPDNKYRQILVDLVGQDYNLKKNGKQGFIIINNCFDILNKCCIEMINFDNDQEIFDTAVKYDLEYQDEYVNYIRDAIVRGENDFKNFSHLSFTDMIWYPNVFNCKAKSGMFIGNKTVGWKVNKVSWIFVDESQDTNSNLLQIIKKFVKGFNCRVCFVGDSNQSIFSFSGARSNSMDLLKEEFNCTVLPLNETFRVPESHVELLNKIFDTNIISKRGINGNIQIISQGELYQSIKPGAMVLARANQTLMQTFLQLLENDIPARLIKFDLKGFFEDLFDTIETSNPYIWDNIYDGLHEYIEKRTVEIRMKYKTYRANMLIDTLNENINVLTAYLGYIRPANREMFFNGLEKLLDDSNKRNYVSLLNIHLCKGLENPKIYILNYNEFPYIRDGASEEQMQQERNVQFVALSRSLEDMYLVTGETK